MATVDKHYIGEIGTDFTLLAVDATSGVDDISAATVHRFDVIKPDLTTTIWAAEISGTQYLTYTVVAGDLDQVGKYKIQSYIEMPGGWKGPGLTFTIIISERFA